MMTKFLGNIPAYAGKAEYPIAICRCSQKHPRIRGESLACNLRRKVAIETSPHTRGKPRPSQERINYLGNIPAYAGKAQGTADDEKVFGKHPRIRGES